MFFENISFIKKHHMICFTLLIHMSIKDKDYIAMNKNQYDDIQEGKE